MKIISRIYAALVTTLLVATMVLPAKAAPAKVYRHATNPEVMVIDGQITKETFVALKKEYRKQKYIVIAPTSTGGDYPTGIEIAKFVGENEISVYITDYCHSSCSFMVMTAPRVYMEKKAIVGIHNISFSVGDGQDENQRVTLRTAMEFAEVASTYAAQMFALYASAGIPGEYLAKAAHMRGNETVKLTYYQLKSWGIVEDF